MAAHRTRLTTLADQLGGSNDDPQQYVWSCTCGAGSNERMTAEDAARASRDHLTGLSR